MMFDRWRSLAPYLWSLLRIVAGFLFIQYGTMKLFAFPAGMPPNNGTAAAFTKLWCAGVLEVVGGTLIILGLFTRPVAFVLSGEMAVAYFQQHAPSNFWPVINQGTPAVLFCFLYLYMSAHGAGPWSLDALRDRWRLRNRPATR